MVTVCVVLHRSLLLFRRLFCGRERAPARVARGIDLLLPELQVPEACGLHEADEGTPHEGDDHVGGHVLPEDAAALHVHAAEGDGREHRDLLLPARAVEVRRVVLQLEEAEGHGLRLGERGEPGPQLVEERARLLIHANTVAQGELEAALGVAEHGVDEGLLAFEEPVERPGADTRPFHHGWNARSVVSALGKELQSGLDHP